MHTDQMVNEDIAKLGSGPELSPTVMIFIYVKQNETEKIKVLSGHRKVHAHCSPPVQYNTTLYNHVQMCTWL